MINTLKTSFKIDMSYATNSFIYILRKLPILKDLITEDAYTSKGLKRFVRIISLFLSFIKMLAYKFLYVFIILGFANLLGERFASYNFIHIFFIFTVLGIFINNRLLNPNSKKYFSVILFGIDAKLYIISNFLYDLFITTILNIIVLLSINGITHIGIKTTALLIIICLLCRIIGEAFSIVFYKMNKYLFNSNTKLYMSISIIFLILSALPFVGIIILPKLISLLLIPLAIIAIISFIYILKIDDYKIIIRETNSYNAIMNKDEVSSYNRQKMVEVRDKDKIIDSKKIKNKHGYDLFNTIFFERHREILLRSALRFSVGIIVIYIALGVMYYIGKGNFIHSFLLNNMGWFVLILYFVNRGSIITQAMFYNSDHAMLKYNFYREENVILGLFKKRLSTVVKVNLIPGVLIAIGNVILLFITGGSNIITYISMFIFIISLCIFFSVHYLVLYYLLQPYNKDLMVKSVPYSVITLGTYLVSYYVSEINISTLLFSIFGIGFSIIYIVVGLLLVKKYAPLNFRIR